MSTRPTPADPYPRLIGAFTATLLVVAAMVGSGVFTTTGFLVRDLGAASTVLAVWGLGGVIALCGALSYAELVAALPQNGGEYLLLSRIYHPAVGFVAGWISLVVGFSAPIAASSVAFGHYVRALHPGLDPVLIATGLVIALSLLHGLRVLFGAGLQNAFTLAKIGLVVAFVVAGIVKPTDAGWPAAPTPGASWLSPAFAAGLILVYYAYSGWNGCAYLAGEVRRPSRTLPLAFVAGTLLVIVLYLALNAVFLASAPMHDLAGVVEVGHVVGLRLFGEHGAALVSAGIATVLVSSVSAMVMAGPRVYEAMGSDYPVLSFLAGRRGSGGPAAATALQAALALALVWTAAFETLLTYIGFTLSLMSGLTVAGVVVLRRREPGLARPVSALGYPITPLLFVSFALWMAAHAVLERPLIALAGGVTVLTGFGAWFVVARLLGPGQRTRPGRA